MSKTRRRVRKFTAPLMVLFGAIALHPIAAPAQNVAIADPPILSQAPAARQPVTIDKAQSLVEAPAIFTGRETVANLDIVLHQSKIWNANSQMFDTVEMRTYRDAARPPAPEAPYVAPTLMAAPGDTVRVLIRNLLPAEADCPKHSGDINVPHCFNATNLHSHGLWVSPAGISDNVLRTLVPNPNFQYEYEYNIPTDHPAGTFWYHPHVHGSTAIQVASGLAGALIVKGARLPSLSSDGKIQPGDVDVLMSIAGKPIDDHIFVLQQIQYICRDPASTAVPNTKVNADGTWRCDAGDVGKLDAYDVFGGARWDNSGRFTTVNGATAAPLARNAQAGVPQRWRFIHGGVADTIRLSIRKKRSPAAGVLTEAAKARSQTAFIDSECAPETEAIPQFELAADGLTRQQILERPSTTLQPGYRSDLLVVFPEAGTYCVIDEEINVPQSGVQGGARRKQLLFTVNVDPASAGTPAATARETLTRTLRDAANALADVDAPTKARIINEIDSGMRLSLFAPHETLAGAAIDTHQKLYFSLNQARTRQTDGSLGLPLGAGIGQSPTTIRRFDPKDFERTLVIGNTDEWELRVDAAGVVVGHPFHIHVNPFEIVSVVKNGAEMTTAPDSQYFGMKGVFKDTIFVEPGAVVTFRTHYRRYVGDFVLHCHILNHEDVGMMEMVRIADRDANGGPIPFGHGLVDVADALPVKHH